MIAMSYPGFPDLFPDLFNQVRSSGTNPALVTGIMEKQHVFELAGLGRAPFRFVGMIQQDLCYGEVILNREEYEKTGVSVTTKPGGSCDFCGQYIVRMFKIQDADGKCFKVGCDCVDKTGDAGLVRAVSKAKRAYEADKRAARKTKKEAAQAQKNAVDCAAELELLGKLAELGGGFASSFAKDVAKRIRLGRCAGMTSRQRALADKLLAEIETP